MPPNLLDACSGALVEVQLSFQVSFELEVCDPLLSRVRSSVLRGFQIHNLRLSALLPHR